MHSIICIKYTLYDANIVLDTKMNDREKVLGFIKLITYSGETSIKNRYKE